MAIYLFLNVVLVSFTFSYIYEAHYFILPLLVGIFVPEFDAEFAQLSTRQEMVPMEVEAEPLNNIES